mmetsp:Transcript_43641/g.88260  ORF Transcript_43641/g.88260 Transcript_43641/m.88260 type:complete len:81 (+) Transcript_43641:653-895(+)
MWRLSLRRRCWVRVLTCLACHVQCKSLLLPRFVQLASSVLQYLVELICQHQRVVDCKKSSVVSATKNAGAYFIIFQSCFQ